MFGSRTRLAAAAALLAAWPGPALADDRVIDLGEPRTDVFYMGGVNALTESWSFGGIGMLRVRRVTNYTFHDLQLHAYVVPYLDDELEEEALTPFAYYGRARYKRSTRSFDFPWLYDWTTYELKTSTEEDLDLRASVASGYGAFLVETGDDVNGAHVNLELGFVLDYASLDAYTQNVSTGYAWGALELDFGLDPLVGKLRNHVSYQLTGVGDSQPTDQTRYDLDARLGFRLGEHGELWLGILHTRYLLLDGSLSGQPEGTLTAYAGLALRH